MVKYMKSMLMCCICVCMFAVGCGSETTNADSVIFETEIESDSAGNETIDVQEETESQENAEDSDLPAVSDPNGIAYENLPDDIKGMLIPIDSLLLYNVEFGGEYNPGDAEMFWQVMHYALVNFGEFYNRAELVESEIVVESMDAAEFATSFVPDFDELPQVPDSLNYGVRYDAENEQYFFGVGDRGLSGTEILSYEYVDNNTLKITARLFAADDDSTIRKGDFTLVRNEYAAGVIEPLFYFSVSEAEFNEE